MMAYGKLNFFQWRVQEDLSYFQKGTYCDYVLKYSKNRKREMRKSDRKNHGEENKQLIWFSSKKNKNKKSSDRF